MIQLQTRAEMSGGSLRLVEDVLADYLKNGPTQAIVTVCGLALVPLRIVDQMPAPGPPEGHARG